MKQKRTVGTGKIYLYSCGAVIALAGIIWLAVNGAYAIYISGDKFRGSWFTVESADSLTPWLLMAAAMAVYYRYLKMCEANNVSSAKQAGVFSLMSVIVPPVFAAADLLAAKAVFERVCGSIIWTQFEKNCLLFYDIIHDYYWVSLDDSVTEIRSPYTFKIMLLLFAVMAVYYYCFFITGYYIMQCLRYGRKKRLIYYAVPIVIMLFCSLFGEKIESAYENGILSDYLVLIFLLLMLILFVTNPIILLISFRFLMLDDFSTTILGFVIMSVYILVTASTASGIGKKQFPCRRRQFEILKNYNAEITAEREEQVND